MRYGSGVTALPVRMDPSTAEVGTSIELFTGGGGLAVAMHLAGFRHLLAVEYDARGQMHFFCVCGHGGDTQLYPA